jgi:uncharacterized membrane protein
MKSPAASDFHWKIALWVSFLTIAAIFAFGAAVKVDFVDPSVPLSDAWNSTDWRRSWHMFGEREYVPISIIAVQAMLISTFHHSPKVRLYAMAASFLVPVFSISGKMLLLAFVSPLLILDVLRGKASGEFYEEGMLMIGACGLWMLLCIAAGIREFLVLRREKKRSVSETRPLEI